MKRVIIMATFALAAQVLVVLATSWYVGQSGGPAALATAFGTTLGTVSAQGESPGTTEGAPAPAAGATAMFPPGFCFACPSFTVDLCEADNHRRVTVGGRVSPDAMLGQDVFVSRAGLISRIGTVRSNGTYQGATPEAFAKVGQTVSVSIRPQGANVAWVFSCLVVAGPPEP